VLGRRHFSWRIGRESRGLADKIKARKRAVQRGYFAMKTLSSHNGEIDRLAAPPGMAAPEIAVIVPNRNDSRYLPRCIRSILEQEDPPDELVVVDDQSTDDSVSVIRSLISGHPRARLLENPVNLGTYGSVDRGLEFARSEYVLFLSANDFVMPGLFARARSCLARHPGAGLWSAMGWLVDEDDQLIRLHVSPVLSLHDAYVTAERCSRLAYRLGNWFVGATLIYHRDTLEAVGKFDPAYMGLADLLTALIVASRRGAAYSPVPLGSFRIHSGSYLSRTLTDSANVETILDRLRERGPPLAPRLFTGDFLERTALRFRFASVRASKGGNIPHIATKYTGLRRLALNGVSQLPPRFYRARITLTFVVLCPFDVLPALWNRLLGSAVVLLLLRLRGQGTYPQARPR
jgi:glycosyltransferase involved in cell wall biosynthesis